MSLFQIAFLGAIFLGSLGILLWIYIDGLKFKLMNAQLDADMYKNLYEIAKKYQIKYQK